MKENKGYQISKVSLQGRRDYNEDTIDIIHSESLGFYGLYDGHGGSFVSNFLQKKLGKNIQKVPKISKK